MDRRDYKQKVEKYIKTGTMTDLQAMSELAFDITMLKQEAYERWTSTEYHQDILRVSIYSEYKNRTRKTDWKSFTDMQADRLAKKDAMEQMDYTDHKNEYMFYKSLLDRLLERKIEVATINKHNNIDTLPNKT